MNDHLPGIHYACPVSSSTDVDRVYNSIDDMLLTGHANKVDELLTQVDVTKCSITIMLSYLTITLVWKDALKNRAALYDRIYDRIGLVDLTRRESLLQGLK